MEEKEIEITEVVAPSEAIIEDEQVTANDMEQIKEDVEEGE